MNGLSGSQKTLSPAQVMELARRGSIPHLMRLSEAMNQQNYDLELLDAFLAHLASKDPDSQPERAALFVIEKGLRNAVVDYPPHLASDVARRITPAYKNIVYWMERSTGGGGDGTWEFHDVDGQRGGTASKIYTCVNLFISLLKIDETCNSDALLRLLPAQQLVLRWWTSTCNTDVLLYAGPGRRENAQDLVYDDLILLVFHLCNRHAAGMANALMMPLPGCEEQILVTFAQKTVQRVRALAQINVLRHLSHWPDISNEFLNVTRLVVSVFKLTRENSHFLSAILQEDRSQCFLAALRLYSARFSTLPAEEGSLEDALELVSLVVMVAEWSSEAPFALSLDAMKRLIASDSVQKADEAAEEILRLSYEMAAHPKAAPAFCLAARRFVLKIKHPLPSPQLEKAVELFAEGCLKNLSPLQKESRAWTCANLEHHLHECNSARGTLKACSECHTIIYCSRRCQAEDWIARHRYECSAMRVEYHGECCRLWYSLTCNNRDSHTIERKMSKSWCSYDLQTFHLSYVRHVYATNNALWNVYKGHQNCLVDTRIVVSGVASLMENPYNFSTVDNYAKMTRDLIPGHKRNRFDELVKRFEAAKPHPKETRNGVSFLSSGLLDWTFHFGDVKLVYAVLLRRRATHPFLALRMTSRWRDMFHTPAGSGGGKLRVSIPSQPIL
ncbi:hypothetical protein NMY22_g2815 [Coprinellus aureogranulatus]|nr:hypothetical protein NMY22_g2815 [Coprinellus aureogranulatus]